MLVVLPRTFLAVHEKRHPFELKKPTLGGDRRVYRTPYVLISSDSLLIYTASSTSHPHCEQGCQCKSGQECKEKPGDLACLIIGVVERLSSAAWWSLKQWEGPDCCLFTLGAKIFEPHWRLS